MPRVKPFLNTRQSEIEQDLMAFSGGARFLDMTQIGAYIGTKNRATIKEWLSDVPAFHRGRKDTWYIPDIAKKIERNIS